MKIVICLGNHRICGWITIPTGGSSDFCNLNEIITFIQSINISKPYHAIANTFLPVTNSVIQFIFQYSQSKIEKQTRRAQTLTSENVFEIENDASKATREVDQF